MMKKSIIVVSLLLAVILSLSLIGFAQDTLNEDDLFSNPESIFETEKIVDSLRSEEEKKSLGISGEATSAIEYIEEREETHDETEQNFSTFIVGNLFFDARLKKGTKCFANIETQYDSETEESDFFLREFFLDFNWKRAAYFRTGKQVLQWGRCFLWNPSDLINVEKKSFIEKIGSREGAYGMKIHIPFGTQYNIYGFLDTGKAQSTDEIGAAGKFEFLVGGTENAFSLWNKKGYRPVYAYDFSTRIGTIDIVGEAAFSRGNNYEKLRVENGVLTTYKEEDQWISRACINFGRSFDFRDINDRISFNLEYYYNEAGYDENLFADQRRYPFSQDFIIYDPSGNAPPITSGTKKDFLLYNNLYEPNNLSKYYVAVFTTTRKFILSDMNLLLNTIGNLNDKSWILTSGVNYTNINDFSFGLTIYSYIGKKDREYTFLNKAFAIELTMGIAF